MVATQIPITMRMWTTQRFHKSSVYFGGEENHTMPDCNVSPKPVWEEASIESHKMVFTLV